MSNELLEKGKKARKRIVIESIIVLLVVMSPFVFKSHEFFSTDPEATINIFGYIIDRNGFTSLSIYAWFMLGKLVPLYLFLIWFFTCKHWWYHILLIPLCMYAFQIFEVLYSDDQYVDTENILWILPVCMLVIPFVYFIRIKLYDKHVHGIDLDAMDVELQYYKDKERRENEKIGMPGKVKAPIEEDLSQKTPNKTLQQLFKQFQHSLRSLFNLFF